MRAEAASWLAVAGLILAAEPSPAQQPDTTTEITYLLNEVATSSCEFYRNGNWYQGRQAAAHLRSKYGARPPWEHIGTAEEFIDRIAARSSVSGSDYRIRCAGTDAVPSASWLRSRLAAFRRAHDSPPEPQPPI